MPKGFYPNRYGVTTSALRTKTGGNAKKMEEKWLQKVYISIYMGIEEAKPDKLCRMVQVPILAEKAARE